MTEPGAEAQPQKQKKGNYNTFTHIIDKAIINFFIGLIVAGAIAISTWLNMAGNNFRTFLPMLLFLVIVVGFGYAFGGIGVVAGSSKEKDFEVTKFRGIAAAVVSSFAYVFPLFFLQVLYNFIGLLMPKFHVYLQSFMPVTKLSYVILINKFCTERSTEICFFNSSFGIFVSRMLDVLIFAIGLGLVFSLINSIVAIFKVSSK